MLVAGDIIRPDDIAGVMRRTNALEAGVVEVFISSRPEPLSGDPNGIRKYTSTGTLIGTTFGGNADYHGLAAKANTNVYATLLDADRINAWTNTVGGTPSLEWTVGPLSGPGLVNRPQGVGVDKFGILHVSVNGDLVMKRYSSAGVYLSQYGGPGRGVSVAASRVLVTDSTNMKVLIYTLAGSLVGEFGSPGDGDGEFDVPRDVDADRFGRIYVADRNNGRVQRFTAGGIYQTQWGEFGSDPGQFASLSGIAVSPLSHVYVVDSGRCQVFDAGGTHLFQFDHFDSSLDPLVALGVGGQTEFFRYPTTSVSEKVSAGTPDAGTTVPSDSFFLENTIRANEIVDIRDAVEALASSYKNAATGGAFNWTNGSANNLYHVAVLNGQYDWNLISGVISIDELNAIDACLSKLEGSELFA